MHRAFFITILLQVLTNSLVTNGAIGKIQRTNACPNEYHKIKNKCFFFSNDIASWQNAHYECKDRHSSFAVIRGVKLNNALKKFLIKNKAFIRTEERWIGGIYDWKQQQWKWVGSQKPMQYKDFYYEKSGNGSAWECIVLDPKNQYKWNSRSCLLKKPYVCQLNMKRGKHVGKKPFNGNKAENEIPIILPAKNSKEVQQNTYGNDLNAPGYLRTQPPAVEEKPIRKRFTCPSDYLQVKDKCYFLGLKNVTWQDAYWVCNDLNATLAILQNNKEDVALKTMIKKYNLPLTPSWLGGRYDWEQMAWKWASSGKLIRYQLKRGEEMRWNCILWNPKRKKWTADGCLEKHNFICQKNPYVMNIYKSRKLLTLPPPVPHVKIDFSVDGKMTSEKVHKITEK